MCVRKKVLIIDDDKDALEVMTYVLEDKDYNVITSYTVDIKDIEKIKPDLILLDNWLGKALGSELCKKLKANPSSKHIPVILISTVSDLSQIAKECNADAYVEKPFDIEHLQGVVLSLI